VEKETKTTEGQMWDIMNEWNYDNSCTCASLLVQNF